jgi:hypothetical protein
VAQNEIVLAIIKLQSQFLHAIRSARRRHQT